MTWPRGRSKTWSRSRHPAGRFGGFMAWAISRRGYWTMSWVMRLGDGGPAGGTTGRR